MISVLYVDDEQSLLEIARLFLEETGGFRVGTAISAKDALRDDSIRSYDAIISDYQMPGMDGIAFLKVVREKYGDVPFILFTGRGREEVVIEAINHGADFYLQKGGDPEAQFAELAHKIRQAVRRKQAEYSLCDSERRLADIINFLPDATFAIDRDGRVIAWNRAIEEMTGIPAAEMLGNGDYAYAVPFYGERRPILIDLIDEPDENIRNFYTSIHRSGSSISAETDLPHPKGDQIQVLAKVCHLYNQAGEITGTIESIRDISEHRRLQIDLEKKHQELQASYEQVAAAEEELREQYDELAAGEKQIRENETRYRNIVDNSPLGMHFYELKPGRTLVFTGANPAADRILGVDHSRFIGQTIEAAFPLLTGTEIPEQYKTVAENGGIWQKEQITYDKGKISGTFAVIAFQTTPRSMVAAFENITERKRREEEVAFTNTLLLTQQETSPDAILIVDENGRIIRYNRQFITLWCVPEDLVARRDVEPVLQYVTKQLVDPEAFLSRVKYLYEHREEKSFEELMLKDGRVLERFSSPMLGMGGKNFGRVWYFRDITSRKKAEESMRQANLVVENSPVILFRRQAKEGWPVVYVSQNVSLLGYTPEELVSGTVPYSSLVYPDDLGRVSAEVQRYTVEGADRFRQQYRIVNRAGDLRWIDDYTVIERDADGTVTHYQGIVLDITEKKQTEDALEKRLIALTQPLEKTGVAFEDLFDMNEIQRLQDEFAKATGVAVLLTSPNGTPITKPSNFCRLCREIVRKTQQGRERCLRSDSILGGLHEEKGPYIHTCHSAGLWGAGANIMLGGRHIANWLIGQVRNDTQSEDSLRKYAREIGVDENEFTRAFLEVPVMSDEQFRSVAQSLYTLASLLSTYAYQNVQQARFITELKQAEETLWQNEQRFRNLIQNASDMIRIIGRDGLIAYTSPSTLRLFGYDPASLAGKDPLAYIHPDDRARVQDALDEVFGKANPGVPTEYRIRHRDGHYVDVEAVATNQLETPGINGIVVTIRPVTERKRAEEALRRREEKYRLMTENSIDIIYAIDPDGTISFVSPQISRYGYRPEDLVSRNISEVILKEDLVQVQKDMNITLATGQPTGTVFRLKNPHGQPIWFEDNGTVMKNENGIVIGISGVLRDITERKQAEAALDEKDARLRRLADNAPDMIYRMSLPDGRYEYVSPASEAITGYTPEEFSLEPGLIRRLIHPSWNEYFQSQWEALLENRAPPFYEYQIIDRTGKTRWLNQRNVPVTDDAGNIVAIEGIVTDITRQKTTERELRRSELRSLAVSANAGEWIWEVDAGGIYRYSSPAVTKILGYLPEELVGKKHYYDLFDPSAREDLKALAAAGFESHEPFRDFINLNRHKNGSLVLLSTSATPVFDDTGTFTGYCGVDEDITERTASEAARQAMVRSMVGTTGLDSLTKIAENVSSWLRADCVMVGEIQPDHQTVKVLSMLLDGKEVSGFTYTLKGTPCENVAGREFCMYPDNAAGLFPESRDLAEMNIRAYIGTPLRDSHNNVIGILCVLSHNPIRPSPSIREIMDILAVKAAAEIERIHIGRELEESRHLLARAMDLAHLVNWKYDVDTDMFTFDDRFYELYGTTAEREGGCQMSAETYAREFVHPDDRWMVAAEVKKALETTDPDYLSHVDHRIIRRDGEIRHISVRIAITRDSSGRTVRTHGANQDITERKRAEEELRESEEKYRTLVETTPDMIWETDPEGKFRYISPTSRAIIGYDPEELAGTSVLELVPEEIRAVVQEDLMRFVTTDGRVAPFEVPSRHRDGHSMIIEIRMGKVTGPDGKLTGLRGVARDVTERRQAEEALRVAHRKLHLLAGITRHDISNQLMALNGFLGLLRRKVTDPALETHFTRIADAGKQIAAMIAFTKEYEKIGVHAPVWQVLATVIDDAAKGILPGQIILKKDFPNDMEIYADPLIVKVFFNLLDNSIRHGQRVTDITVSCHKSGNDLVVLWEDNGIGIADDEKEQIFGRGFGKNTGLGMFLAREILSLTGITIRETGKPFAGARFEITVPGGAFRNNVQ